jgi:hypothetical protein
MKAGTSNTFIPGKIDGVKNQSNQWGQINGIKSMGSDSIDLRFLAYELMGQQILWCVLLGEVSQ